MRDKKKEKDLEDTLKLFDYDITDTTRKISTR
jgi:hypothetical protein